MDIAPRWLHHAARMICGPGVPDQPGGQLDLVPFSVGALVPFRQPSGAEPTASPPTASPPTAWRLGWLDDGAPPPAWPPAEARFGSVRAPVAGSEVHHRSYAELARGLPIRAARLTMTTPTFFSREGRDLPLPDPALAVGGLLRRWNSYAPGPLRIGAQDARSVLGAVYLGGVWGASVDVDLGHGLRQTGFTGQAELRLLAGTSDYTATMFAALARFAAFAGLGARTAYGFGATDVDLPADTHGDGRDATGRDEQAVPPPRRGAAVTATAAPIGPARPVPAGGPQGPPARDTARLAAGQVT